MTYTNIEEALENPLAVKRLHLVKQKSVKKFLKRISELCNLEELHIESCSMSSIPPELWELSELKSLTIIDCGYKLKEYPPEMGQLSALEKLCLGKQSMETLPDAIGQLTQLKSLRTIELLLTQLPNSLSKLKNLRSLEILDARLEVLPNSIKELTNLEKLALNTRIRGESQPFPDDFFEGFKKLKELSLINCDMTYFSKSIASLATLEYLDLSENSFTEFPIDLLKLTQIGEELHLQNNKHYAYGTPTNLNQANELKLLIEKYEISLEDATCYFGCLGGYMVTEMNNSALLGALTQPELPDIIRINALDQVTRNYEEQSAKEKLSSGHKMAIVGSYKLSKNELKVCTENNVTIVKEVIDSIPADCTHALIGEKVDATKRIEGSCQLMAPRNFTNWLNDNGKGYLSDQSDDSSSEMQEDVFQLLDSGNDENIETALDAMKETGAPKEAISLLFIMAKMDHNVDIKRKAKKLVAKMLSNKATDNLKIRGSFKTSPDFPALIHRLRGGIENEISADALYKYAYIRFGQEEALIPHLMRSQDQAIRQIAWDHTCDGNRMILQETWGMPDGEAAKEDIPKLQHIEELLFWGNGAGTVASMLKELKNIQWISLLETPFTTWTTSYDVGVALSGFEKLFSVEISLSHNYESILTVFDLTFLRELHLSEMPIDGQDASKLSQLPSEILKLKQLKSLTINHDYANIQNLEILAGLDKLEYLSLKNCPIETIPMALEKLTNLKTLNLINTKVEGFPKELQSKLPKCTILM